MSLRAEKGGCMGVENQKTGRRVQRSLGSSGRRDEDAMKTRIAMRSISAGEQKEGRGLLWNGLSKTGCEITSDWAVGALRGLCEPHRTTIERECAMMREYRLQHGIAGRECVLSPKLFPKGSLLVWR